MRDNFSGDPPTAYHPSYEFPGGEDSSSHPGFHMYSEPTPPPSHEFPICRLVIQESRFVPHKQRLAVIDGYSEVQFGRDAAPPGVSTPRIRLKDMEVSKLHATLFWDAGRHEWAVVDMGSKHGTFIGSGQDAKRVRLSATRVASMPKRVGHQDRLYLGGTTFMVHIHENRLPCVDCSASGQGGDDIIPLFSHQKGDTMDTRAERGRKRGVDTTEDVPRDAKRALASLKHSLLNRPGGFLPPVSAVDESLRRSNYGDSSVHRRGSSTSDGSLVRRTTTASREASRFSPIIFLGTRNVEGKGDVE
jgi:FHA domain